MQNFLKWLNDNDMLDPLLEALETVAAILFVIWCVALGAAAVIGIPLLALCISAWWLLAYIPLLVLLVITLTVYNYIIAL